MISQMCCTGAWRITHGRLAPVGALLLFTVLQARAGLINYTPAEFTFTNTDADGAVVMPVGGPFVITGGNTGSGDPGTSDLTALARGSGTVSFSYSFDSLDFPGWESAGYLLRGAYFPLTDIGGICGGDLCPGTVQFDVNTNDVFGWRVFTKDNTGEPGVLTIDSLDAPLASAVPEPATWASVILGLAGLGLVRRRARRTRP